MKTLVIIMTALLLMTGAASALEVSSLTFTTDLSVAPSNPNLRIGVVKGPMASDGNTVMQGMPIPRPVNYAIASTKTYTIEPGTIALEIQVDQDTKMYVGSDLTNYLLLPADTVKTYTVR